jgi:hypothetical protein
MKLIRIIQYVLCKIISSFFLNFVLHNKLDSFLKVKKSKVRLSYLTKFCGVWRR